MENKKLVSYSLLLDDTDQEIVNRIKELRGIRNTSDVFRQGIREWVVRIDDPSYVKKRKDMVPRVKYENPEDRVKAKLERKQQEDEAKRAIEIKRGFDLCEELDGEIIEQENGAKACKFKLYEKFGNRVIEGMRVVPLDNLHKSHVTTQYKGGTKAEVHEILQENKS